MAKKDSDKSLEEVAQECAEGKWGVGQERRLKLQQAGYNPREVEAEVVRIRNNPQARRNTSAEEPEGSVRGPGTTGSGSETRGASTGSGGSSGKSREADVEDRGQGSRKDK